MEQLIIGFVSLLAFFVWYAYHQNVQADISWKKMHEQFLDNIEFGDNPKAFYSHQLLERLVPALSNED